MLMEIDPLSRRGSMVMTMAMISSSRRDVSPVEQLRRSPRLVLPWFPLETTALRPESFFLIFFQVKTHHIAEDGRRGPARGPTRTGARPTPLWLAGAPLWCFLHPIFFIYSKNDFRGVLGLLELCRIGFQYLLLFQPEFQLLAFPLFMVNLVK